MTASKNMKNATAAASVIVCSMMICSFTSAQSSLSSPRDEAVAGHEAETAASDKTETSAKAEGFDLSLKTDKSRYGTKEPIDIFIRLTDVDQKYWSTVSADRHTYSMDMRHSDGKPVALTDFGEKYKKGGQLQTNEGLTEFTPGVSEDVPLYRANSFFDMSSPDEYVIQVSRRVPSLDDPKKMVTISSNVVTITVGEPKAASDDDAAAKTDEQPED